MIKYHHLIYKLLKYFGLEEPALGVTERTMRICHY